MKSNRAKIMHYSVFELLFWGAFAAYYPYQMVFLDSKGVSNIQIGTILALNSFIAIFAQPFWGMASDKVQSIKKVFIFLFIIAMILIGSLPLYQGAILLGTVFVMITFFESPLVPLLDSWVVQGIQDIPEVSYGNIRLWGSVGFAIMVYIYGQIMDFTGVWILYPSFAVAGIFALLVASKVKVDPPVDSRPIKKLRVGSLLKNYDYVIFLIFATLLFIPHKASFTYLPRLMERVGGDNGDLGLALSIMALSEAPLFLLTKRLLIKIKPLQIIIFSTIFFIVRQYLFSIASSPVHIILIQGTQGLAFALFLTGAVYYIHSLAPDELKATAQTVGTALYMGVSGIVGNYGGGWVLERFGLISLYHIGLFLTLGITVIFILLKYIHTLRLRRAT